MAKETKTKPLPKPKPLTREQLRAELTRAAAERDTAREQNLRNDEELRKIRKTFAAILGMTTRKSGYGYGAVETVTRDDATFMEICAEIGKLIARADGQAERNG